MAVLVTWWRSPENALGIPDSRLAAGVFDIQGIVPVAYSVSAVALGIAAGSMFRRVLPAMAVTLGAFTVSRLAPARFVPARESILGVPGHRNGNLPCPCRWSHRPDLPGCHQTRRVRQVVKRFKVQSSVSGAPDIGCR